MKECRKYFSRHNVLTPAEAEAIQPKTEDLEAGGEAGKQGNWGKDKDAEEALSPRAVTEKGFPITKAGYEKFVEMSEEVEIVTNIPRTSKFLTTSRVMESRKFWRLR